MKENIKGLIIDLFKANPRLDIKSKLGLPERFTKDNYETEVNTLSNDELVDFATTLVTHDFLLGYFDCGDRLAQSVFQIEKPFSESLLKDTEMYNIYNSIFKNEYSVRTNLEKIYSSSTENWCEIKQRMIDDCSNAKENDITISDKILHYLQKFVNFLKVLSNKLLKILGREKNYEIKETTLEAKEKHNQKVESQQKWSKIFKEYEKKVTGSLNR